MLRTQTACLHKQIEVQLGLPFAIQTLDDYRAWLSRFLGLYGPLEQTLAAFTEWRDHGLSLPNHSFRLGADLGAIGVDPAGVLQAPPALVPRLTTFAQALGAVYVLEGSEITGATRFFGGGAATDQTWQSFKTALDGFGHAFPGLRSDVISGAEGVFRAISAWFVPLHVKTECRS
jgi:heme oxygenase